MKSYFFSELFYNWRTAKYKKIESLKTQDFEKLSDDLLNELDREYRFKEINGITPRPNELKTNLTYVLNKLYETMLNASNSVYAKIQTLEANYSNTKSELDNKLYYELQTLQGRKEELEREKEETKRQLGIMQQRKEEIEYAFSKTEEREVYGDLQRIPRYFFWIVLLVVGMAEFYIYQNVFLSQEIKLFSDMQSQEQIWVTIFAGLMSLGFVVMIIWMADALGKLLRHYPNTIQKEKKFYLLKMGIITAVTIGAIWGTVNIRSKMYSILAMDQDIVTKKEQQDRMQMNIFDDNTVAQDDPFGEDKSASNDASDEDNPFGDDQGSKTVSKQKSPNDAIDNSIEKIRTKINKKKEDTADVFILINIFIFVGGVFLSYFSHTSSPIYEMVLDEIKKLQRDLKKLQKQIQKIDVQIVRFKKYEINPLFKRLLYDASLYDLHVRTYNGYRELFLTKFEMIEEYLRDRLTYLGVDVEGVDIKRFIAEHIKLDERNELQHVNNIESYMIYKFTTPKNLKDIQNETNL